ncbi:MAG: lysine--tRNA ligase [Microgenomates group bacterium]
MIWVDREVKKIKELNLPQVWIDDMKTPSGRVHVGALRGVVIHDLLYKAFTEQDDDVNFSYVFNNMDQMDAIPSYLDYEKWEKYAGMPLYKIPSPESGFANFAEFYAKEFITVFESINCHPKIIWSSDLYESGKMNDVIREALDKAAKIRELYKTISKSVRPDNWYPFQIICENCGKVGTTSVTGWDGTNVTYVCNPEMVAWAEGCGNQGSRSPFDGNGKLHWKVDWPAHWKKIGVTIEGSGKDHMSAGGSYDLSSSIAREALGYEAPYAPAYEWFTIGGAKMSSSKGIGTSAKDAAAILPPDILRFLLVRTPIERSIDFNPFGDTIPNIFDDYDRCFSAYFDKLENKVPEGKQGEVIEDFARIAELSQVRPLPMTRMFLPRFRTIVNLLKTRVEILEFFEKQKGSALNDYEKELLEERIIYAEGYLKAYAEDADKVELLESLPDGLALTESQKMFLQLLGTELKKLSTDDRDNIQDIVFTILKENNLQAKEVFKAFYQILIGKEFGPKAADLILEFGVKTVISRIDKVFEEKNVDHADKSDSLFPILKDSSLFSIDDSVLSKFSSITVGVAVIKGVTIGKSPPELQKEINDFLTQMGILTTEMISSYPEIKSYRKLYKATGVDWHSRRPSPEALLRRYALKKEIPSINSCVDAYNLIVMKHRISVGAFDLDQLSLPTILRFAKEGEDIHLLGDVEPTKYGAGELAYFDQLGGYNIDFNYRDSKHSAVTERTRDILINTEGVFDISPKQVEQVLKETIEIITKYCGGTVEKVGIVTET